MQKYLIRRLLLAIPTLIGVSIIIFLAMRVIPGDPLSIIYTEDSIYILSDEEIFTLRESLGLTDPLWLQYSKWMWEIAKGDMGHSFWKDFPIRDIIVRRFPITGQIALMAVAMSWIVGLPVGVLAAMRRNSWMDYSARFFITLFLAIPGFWFALAILLMTILLWGWRPSLQIVQIWENPQRNLAMTFLPAIVFAMAGSAIVARMTRATLLEVLREDYVRTAHAKGLNAQVVLIRHALRNAVLPVITITGLMLAGILGGSVALERAFAVPGLGFTFIEAIVERDWMMIQNLTLFFGFIFVSVNLIVDILYAYIDPRIRYS
jgi:peptide/nickel transport system permease protein